MADAGGFEYGLPSSAAAEIAVVRAIYDAFARRDVDAALPYVDATFEVLPSGTAELVGRTQPYRGADGMRQYIADAERVWAELTLHADDIRAISGSVVVFGRVEGREAGTGAAVERRVLWTWKLRDGRAISLRVNDFGG
jgi:ketosteroid isomerase-like protein